MASLTGRKPYQKTSEAADPERLSDIHDGIPCVICLAYGLAQRSPTQAHHPIHGRGGSRKSADSKCVALCEGHHQGDFDTSKVAVHREPEEWKRLYGSDFEWIEETNRLLTRYEKL